MAQYEITTPPLFEAESAFRSLVAELSAVLDQLDGVVSALPESMLDIRRQITAERKEIENLSQFANKLGQTLSDVIDVYARAEQMVFGEADQAERQQTVFSAVPPTIVHRTYGVFMSGDLVLQDWLQAAVIKYEQSKSDSSV